MSVFLNELAYYEESELRPYLRFRDSRILSFPAARIIFSLEIDLLSVCLWTVHERSRNFHNLYPMDSPGSYFCKKAVSLL